MNNKRPYGKAFGVTVQRKPFKPFPQNTTPMVLYRTPSQNRSLINPPYKRVAPEKKNVDVLGSVGLTNSAGWSEVDLLNGMAEGTDGAGQRIGRKIQMSSILLRYVTSSTLGAQPFRVLIIYDKQSDGNLPGSANIVQDGLNFLSPMNLNQSDRFVVIADEMINPNTQFTTTGTIYRKLNLPVHYQSNTALITGMASGSVYVLCGANGTIGSGIGYYSRIRYTDI